MLPTGWMFQIQINHVTEICVAGSMHGFNSPVFVLGCARFNKNKKNSVLHL